MNVFSRSSLCLALVAVAVGAHAQANNSAKMIFGTYQVTATHNCLTAMETGMVPTPFVVQHGADGTPFVNVATGAQTRALTTVSHMTLTIDPTKGTLGSQDLVVNRIFATVNPNNPDVLQRTHRTMQGTFTVDQATNTLLLGPRTETGTIPDDGSSSVWVWGAGSRWKTNDVGQTFVGAESDEPVLLEQTITKPDSTIVHNAVLCVHTVTGQRTSLRF
jgi:hypothetical protein